MGNHEEMMLGAREGRSDLRFWLTPTCGGLTTLQSYGPAQDVSLIPREHWAFLASLPLYYEADGHFFVHANYAPNQHFRDQVSQTLLWLDLSDLPGPHFSRKVAVVGHTPQNDGNILRLDHLVCIDTGCGHGGLLTALDVASGRIWQVTEDGQQV
jgi:serine/threonine protein phosphatase 1